MSDKFHTFAMSYFCSFPPKFTFPGCSEEFLFPLAKIRNLYRVSNQLVINIQLFCGYCYLLARALSISSSGTVPPHIRNTYSGVISVGSIEQERDSISRSSSILRFNSVLSIIISIYHNPE